jgi:predicted membrane protein
MLTESVFSNMYMQQVYSNSGEPPNILTMLGILFAINFGFVLFLSTVIILLMYIFNKNNTFVINMYLLKLFIIDYLVFTLVLGIVLVVIGLYMQSKKYFRYKTEGLRAIRAFGDIATSVSAGLVLVPYFAIF